MKKIIAIIILIIIILGGVFAYNLYNKIYKKNVIETAYLYIPTDANFDMVTNLISPYIKNQKSFAWVAKKKNYPNKIRAGKFKISEGMSNEALVNHLRGGKAEMIKLTFNNQDTFEKLAGRVANQIEADSVSILNAMKEEDFLKENEFSNKTGLAMYIPNSYEFYWNTSAKKFRNKMLSEYKRYWNASRINKAKKQNLTPIQVVTLASIVQKETATIAERPKVAGLYLNRLKGFWPLQADPTIIYAVKQKEGQDYEIKRVLNKDLTIDSPYNTYTNFGLPPGPISMPDISSIEAVLNPLNHKYYYMCASIENMGQHEFAKTLSQHNINARKYQNWINKQGIKR
ncbi:MAG: endolytic transglycosylase MltG [Flavobacteriaceae bacterium]|nr:endolytic transglycosylase MltG [Flavobacteriaceae bacterium]